MKGTKREIRPGTWACRVYVGRSATGSPVFVTKTIHGGVRAADKVLNKMVADHGGREAPRAL
jgi:hypothetical protein